VNEKRVHHSPAKTPEAILGGGAGIGPATAVVTFPTCLR
jgi:hypothetical protein